MICSDLLDVLLGALEERASIGFPSFRFRIDMQKNCGSF